MKYLFFVLCIFTVVSCVSVSDKKHEDKVGLKDQSRSIDKYKNSNKLNKSIFKTQIKNIDVNYKVVSAGSSSKLLPHTVIRNSKDLKIFYQTYFNRNENLPQVDFNTQSLVVASAGVFPTGGYSVELIYSKNSKKTLFLEFKIKEPAPGEIVTQAFTRPYTILCIDVKPEQSVDVKLMGEQGLLDGTLY